VLKPTETNVQIISQRTLVRPSPAQEGSVLPTAPVVAKARPEPEWARNVLQSNPLASLREPPAEVREQQSLVWRIHRDSGLAFAQVPGATVIALEREGEYVVDEESDAEFRVAQQVLSSLRRGHLELGVVALGGRPRVDEDFANDLAEQRIVFADEDIVPGMVSAAERAERYIEQFLTGRSRQRDNFARYVARVRAGK
jgi:hypothetical protein